MDKSLNRIKRTLAYVPGVLWLKRKLFGMAAGRVPKTQPIERGAPPQVDPVEIRRAYSESPLSGERDTFVLYRIIGNDLYPRHRKGQCRDNLRFILENEPPLEDCEKRFVVNRIFDADEERKILELLRESGAPFIHIPFEPEEYRRYSWDVLGVPAKYAPFDPDFPSLHETHQDRVMMRLYRHKNNYLMNNNGARNAALFEGRKLAKWVLPWDGNCFMTKEGWDDIRREVSSAPEYPYHIVPMARIVDNAEVLRPGFRPPADEEPQILFRRDAEEAFDPECFYGRRPKVELLWRLGVPGQWDYWTVEPWDIPCPPFSPDAGRWKKSGWVVRLSSGKPQLEQGKRSLKERGTARVEAIAAAIDRVDELVSHETFDSRSPVFVDVRRNRDNQPLLEQLKNAADEALSRESYSVVDKTTLPPSGDVRDYWHPAAYYWPNPLPIPGLPYIYRDGRRAPGTRLYEPASDKYDRTRLQRMYDDTYVLALAFAQTGDGQYAEHAANHVRRWFLDPETRMNPHLRFASAKMGRQRKFSVGAGIIEAKDVYYFLDAVRILSDAGALNESEQQQLQEWYRQYLGWLLESPEGNCERARPNNHGTYYDLHVASVAAYLGEYIVLRNIFRDSRFRLVRQFNADGEQPEELRRTATAHYCCFNLQGWVHLATLAERFDEDLWFFEGPDGQNLRTALRWLFQFIGREWPYEQVNEFDAERFLPLYHSYRRIYGDTGGVSVDIQDPAQVKPVFHPHDGIRPFWQIS